jgi:diguanylate cyclase (GGDEF)-like protein
METNKLVRLVKPHTLEVKASVTVLESSGSALSYALKFQSQLCIETLIQTFEECMQSILNFDGIRYRYPLLGIAYSTGSTYKAQCTFHLKTDDDFLGDITLYKQSKLSDNEIKNIELISSLLVHPLRSAIQQKSNFLLSANENITGVTNAALVEKLVTREAKLSYREQVPMSLILFDIDRFQKFSEYTNFIARDKILYELMKIMCTNIRDTDLLFRYDNDTFCLILKGVTMSNAFGISERIRNAIDNHKFITAKNKPAHITVSAGITELLSSDNIESIFERTSHAVQHAKKMGRNQSIVNDGEFIS